MDTSKESSEKLNADLDDLLLSGKETRLERRKRPRFEYEIRGQTIDLYGRYSKIDQKEMLHPLYQTSLVLDELTFKVLEQESVDRVIQKYITELVKRNPEHPFDGTPIEKWWNTHGFGMSHIDYLAKNIKTDKWVEGCVEIKGYSFTKDHWC